MTYTRTHVFEQFANPHLICDNCRQPVAGWHDNTRCGCGDTWWNNPCGCKRASVVSNCPSWGPVDGCTCTPSCPAAVPSSREQNQGRGEGGERT